MAPYQQVPHQQAPQPSAERTESNKEAKEMIQELKQLIGLLRSSQAQEKSAAASTGNSNIPALEENDMFL